MTARAAISRAAGLFGLWLVLSGVHVADLPAAAVAVGTATWASLRLLPPGPWRLRPIALAGLVLRFLRQSVVAGVDVAWRALDPRLPVRPGLVVYSMRTAPGSAHSTFRTLASLVPGTVPVGRVDGGACSSTASMSTSPSRHSWPPRRLSSCGRSGYRRAAPPAHDWNPVTVPGLVLPASQASTHHNEVTRRMQGRAPHE
jgi:multicomponent Na+:H+ antiporter subunit E